MKYYKGQTVSDKTGQVVFLGGSRVHNLADNLEYFGLNPGTSNVYEVVYTTFGDIVKNMYPSLMPKYPAYAEVVDLSYLKNVASTYAPSKITVADEVKFDTERGIQNTVSKRSWNITFKTGSAEFNSDAYTMLEQIYSQAAIGSGLQIKVSGHTDNVGSDDINIPLSQRRADAVKNWLENRGGSNISGRITSRGYGSTIPVASNESSIGREQNRRVEILMGN